MSSDNVTPYKPAFPQWIRRIDPLLEAEDTNMLFQAFRERRLRRGGLLRSVFSRQSLFAVSALILTIGFIIVLGYLLIKGYGFWSIFLAAIVFAFMFLWGVRALHASARSRPELPAMLGEVYGILQYMETAAVELWLCGVSGRDVVLAIYLERRESRVLANGWVMLASFFPLYAAITALPSPAGIVLLLTLAVCLPSFIRAANWYAGSACVDLEIRKRLLFWGNQMKLKLPVVTIGIEVAWGLVIVGVALLVCIGIVRLDFLGLLFLGSAPDAIADYRGTWSFCLILLLVHWAIWRFLPGISQKTFAEAEAMLAAADESFDSFMRVRVVKDMDAEYTGHLLRSDCALELLQEPKKEAEQRLPTT